MRGQMAAAAASSIVVQKIELISSVRLAGALDPVGRTLDMIISFLTRYAGAPACAQRCCSRCTAVVVEQLVNERSALGSGSIVDGPGGCSRRR